MEISTFISALRFVRQARENFRHFLIPSAFAKMGAGKLHFQNGDLLCVWPEVYARRERIGVSSGWRGGWMDSKGMLTKPRPGGNARRYPKNKAN